jgi:hypothetical protein
MRIDPSDAAIHKVPFYGQTCQATVLPYTSGDCDRPKSWTRAVTPTLAFNVAPTNACT